MSLSSQMGLDIRLATEYKVPLYGYLTSKYVPTTQGIVDFCKGVLAGDVKELEVYLSLIHIFRRPVPVLRQPSPGHDAVSLKDAERHFHGPEESHELA